MITNFRKDLNEPNLWFIAGELGHWRIDSKTQHSRSQNFNNMIRQINKHIPYTDYVKADELVSRGDLSDSHFSRESCITLGERYAQKYSNTYTIKKRLQYMVTSSILLPLK